MEEEKAVAMSYGKLGLGWWVGGWVGGWESLPAVHFQADVVARLVNHLAGLLELLEGLGNEGLSAEAGVHGHEEDDVLERWVGGWVGGFVG